MRIKFIAWALFPLSVAFALPNETTEDPSVLKIDQAHLILDAQNGAFQVLEMLRIANSSEKTFIGEERLSEGKRLVVRFLLPHGAQGTEIEQGFEECCLVEIPEGFGWTHPIPPGAREVGYSYVVPYKGRRYTFQKVAPYPIQSLDILVRGFKIESKEISLQEDSPVSILDREYRHFTAEGIPTGGILKLEISSLPLNIKASVWIALGFGILLLGSLVYAIKRRIS
jgi:hypothetical protein